MRNWMQKCRQANPLMMWAISIGFLLSLDWTLYFAVPGTRNEGLFMLFTVMALSPPTSVLLDRFSEAERLKNPVPPRQEAQVGLLSLLLAICSICALLLPILSKHLHLPLSRNAGMGLLVIFSLSALLSLSLGYAARHSKAGQWGVKLAAGWIISLVVLAFGFLLWNFGTLYSNK